MAEIIGITDRHVDISAVGICPDADVRPVKMDISADWGGYESILEYIYHLVTSRACLCTYPEFLE